jgi:enamine deaminase RidA (YjgF/YER057c/UK114 family)
VSLNTPTPEEGAMTTDRFTRVPAPAIPGISDSVKVTSGDLLYVSGAVGFEADGSVPADFDRAIELTFRELERALVAGGASFSSLARITVYITHLDKEKLQAYRRVRDTIIDTDNIPASTVIGVYSLFNDATIEIEAIAAV